MKKIVIDDRIPFLNGVFEPYFEQVLYRSGAAISPVDAADADALVIRTRTRCDAALLRDSAVKIVATATIGMDHIDTAYCRARNIEVANAAGCNAAGVSQYIAAALLEIARRRGLDLRGKTLGIVGVGNVGGLVARVGEAFGMNVLLNDPPRAEREGGDRFVALERIIAESDFITLHVPLTKGGPYATFHMADEAFFCRMKPTAFLLNAARGEVCSAVELKSALHRGMIAGAVLDVWENEPEIDCELLRLLICGTPHIAGYSADGKANGSSMAVRAVARRFGIGPLLDFAVRLSPETEVLSYRGSWYDVQRRVYDIGRDTAALCAAPEQFERLRNEYAFRRENGAFAVAGAPEQTAGLLGFREAEVAR